jgi:hypothetical protein
MPPNFRPATRVSAEQIRSLDEDRLRDVMAHLLRAEGFLCEIPANEITVSDNVRAGDDGCDGWSPAHRARSDWLPDVETCWQLKSGSAGEPARLKGEVLKPKPRETLKAGGAFVVVASQASGEVAAEKRREVVRQEAREAGLPTDRIIVYTCENLADWCNSIPAISSWIAGIPTGFLLFEEWLRDDQHAGPFYAGERVAQEIARARRILDFRSSGRRYHLHIAGQPGIGRSRLAMEIVRDTGLQELAIYSGAFDQQVGELLGQVRAELTARLLLIVDQVAPESVGVLNQQVRLAEGRIRLITISSEQPGETDGIELLNVGRLGAEEMRRLVQSQRLGLPFEHLDFVVRFADGFVKLARIVWRALREDPDVRGLEALLDQNDIRGFLNRLLGGLPDEDRGALEVVALMARVGRDGEVETEGEAITRLFDLNWPDVRGRLRRIDDRLGIVPRAGRYRHVSPQPLALRLAGGALDDYGAIIPQLPDRLPSHSARLALFRRLSQLSDHPVVGAMCQELFDRFSSLAELERSDAAELWDQAAMADPPGAIRAFRRILDGSSSAQRRSFADNSFGAIWTLEKLARRSETFVEAMYILAELAIVESGLAGYSPSRIFADRLRVVWGGTDVAFVDRLGVLDELHARPDPAYTRLVIQALATAVSGFLGPIVLDGSQDLRDVSTQWQPRDLADDVTARREALVRLAHIARAGVPDHEAGLVKAVIDSLPLMRCGELVGDVRGLVEGMVQAYPECRERLRSKITIHLEIEAHRRDSDPAFSAALQALRDSVADRSFRGRLRQHAEHPRLGTLPPPASLDDLVDEIIAQPDLIGTEWAWLTSGDAHNAMELGAVLGRRDVHGAVLPVLENPEHAGPDLRFLAAYLMAHSAHHPEGWLDVWLEERNARSAADAGSVLEVTCLVGESTGRSARRLLDLLRDHVLPPMAFNRLRFSRWAPGLPAPEFHELFDALASYTELRGTALFLAFWRLQHHPEELDTLEGTLLHLVTDPSLLRSDQFQVWQSVARPLVRRHASQIAEAAFAALRDGPGYWHLAELPAGTIVIECIEADPDGVWTELSRLLEDPDGRPGFVMNLPAGLADRFPQERILGWAADSSERLVTLARLAAPNFQDDQSLAAVLADRHGAREDVSTTLFNHLCGTFSDGHWSQRWAEHASNLEQVARTTRRSGLRRWARVIAERCRSPETNARLQEDEERMGA